MGNAGRCAVGRPLHQLLHVDLMLLLQVLHHTAAIAEVVGAAGIPMGIEFGADHGVYQFRGRGLTNAAGDADGLGRVTGAAGADDSGIRLKRIVHHHAGVISNLLRSQQELCALLHGRFRQLGQLFSRCAVVFIGCDVADQRHTARAGIHSEVQLRIHLVGGGGGQAQRRTDILLRQYPLAGHVAVLREYSLYFFDGLFHLHGLFSLPCDAALRQNGIAQAAGAVRNIAGYERLPRHADLAVLPRQLYLQDAGGPADGHQLAGDKVAHGPRHRHDASIAGGDEVVGLDGMGVRADNIIGSGIRQLLRHAAHGGAGLGLILRVHAPVDIGQDKLGSGGAGRGDVRRRPVRRVLVEQGAAALIGKAGLVAVIPRGPGQQGKANAVDLHQREAALRRAGEQAGAHEAGIVDAVQRLPNAGGTAVQVVVIGQHQEVEARLTHRVQKRLGRVAVVFAVHLILLAGVGRGGAEHGLQIADGEVGGGEIGSDEGEHVVEIRPTADEMGLVELLLRQHVAHAGEQRLVLPEGGLAVHPIGGQGVAEAGRVLHRFVMGRLRLVGADIRLRRRLRLFCVPECHRCVLSALRRQVCSVGRVRRLPNRRSVSGRRAASSAAPGVKVSSPK